ncbi:MAG TPA: hypothetical protein VMC80_02065 [Patescibacteria group bacterium]|nr:hypothetical protein [Patescibacteria group bacterium]
MFNRKEVIAIIIATVIIGFSVSIFQDLKTIIQPINFLWTLLAVFVILLLNVLVKKIMALYYESEAEIKLWDIRRFGFKAHQHFKKPFPLGAVLPILSKIILFPLKSVVWMASLVFDVNPKAYRASRRHGLYSFAEMTEYHLGIIAASGILVNLIAAVIGYLLGFSDFARLSIYFTFFNMLPVSDLDGNKIFFGNIVMWSFLASLVVLGILFAIFLV